ncbi:restriction endonuclease subunit S [Neobacillus sp. YIM B06451]|uniref:restriction endonuclease subunit S n=1 Tax=Neobacillus sp. YIM B06451 TaxID=3070994 RepID=UPI0029316CC7|nr:restriction endonuclease subunit S [Neobacillus sp. YIM B06451]
MGLTKLGLYIEQLDLRNNENLYKEDAVVGLSTQKQMIKTKADLEGVSLTSYKLMPPGSFAYVPDTSRRGDKMSLGFNDTAETFLVSSISIVFIVKKIDELLSYYLYMYFNRPEFDRYARYNSWGSARETFSWDDMCDIDIDLPPIPIQQKYIDVYNAMLANQQSYERGLEDLKLVCDGYIEDLQRKIPSERIGDYIQLSEDRNEELKYGIADVRGISIEKRFIETKAEMQGVGLKPYYIIHPDEFAYITVTSRNGEKISLAHNGTEETYICSSSYIVFRSMNAEKLYPKYLKIFFSRNEFDRYARFNSWGSARETFDWEDMCDVKIPIPDIKVQHAIADIYTAYTTRKEINEKLKAQLKDLCPVLIKGSLEEAKHPKVTEMYLV